MDLKMQEEATKFLLKLLNQMRVDGDTPEEKIAEEMAAAPEAEAEEAMPEANVEIEAELEPEEDDMTYIKNDMKKSMAGKLANLPIGKKAATAGTTEFEIGPLKKIRKALG